MHQAQASSTTSLTADNCSSLDIKPSIQQNGTSQSSAPKQREGTTSSSGNTNTHNNNNSSSSNNNNNTNSSSNQSSSLNGGLFDNAQSVYGNTGSAYDSNYQSYHQANNVAAATGSFHSGNATSNGGIGGTNIASMRSNLSPPIHSHHHHHSSSLSSSSSVGNKPQRTKPRTSAGEKETTFLTFFYILTIDWSIIFISPNSPSWTKLSISYENSCSWKIVSMSENQYNNINTKLENQIRHGLWGFFSIWLFNNLSLLFILVKCIFLLYFQSVLCLSNY